MYLIALNPTDSVTEGFLPAAHALGTDVTLLTDHAEPHRRVVEAAGQAAVGDVEILECDVTDHHALITRIATHRPAAAVFTNSDHLQTQTALTAAYFGLPGKDWRATLRTKDKAEMRRHLAAAGLDTVRALELAPGQDPAELLARPVPYPCVVKPREGVASEDVVLARGAAELLARCAEIQARRPSAALVVEEYLPGELYTLETLGDGRRLHVVGGFHTELSPPPYFVETRMTYVPRHPDPIGAQVLGQLACLGVGFGACHTEFVVRDGRARVIEVNYRAVGDQGDLMLRDLLGFPLFEHILRTHLGEPLPDDLRLRRDAAARVDYVCAPTAGTLTVAPAPADLTSDAVRLTYRPLRTTGEHHPLHHTNRDYVGILRTTGPDQPAVDQAADTFLAAQRWEFTP